MAEQLIKTSLNKLRWSENYADLEIEYEYDYSEPERVHRAIVCEGSPWFASSEDVRKGFVKVEESPSTMHYLLNHLYGIELDLYPWIEGLAEDAAQLLKAADKYQVPSLSHIIETVVIEAFKNLEPKQDPKTLLLAASYFYYPEVHKYVTARMHDAMMQSISARISKCVELDWSLLGDGILGVLKRVMVYLAKDSPHVTQPTETRG